MEVVTAAVVSPAGARARGCLPIGTTLDVGCKPDSLLSSVSPGGSAAGSRHNLMTSGDNRHFAACPISSDSAAIVRKLSNNNARTGEGWLDSIPFWMDSTTTMAATSTSLCRQTTQSSTGSSGMNHTSDSSSTASPTSAINGLSSGCSSVGSFGSGCCRLIIAGAACSANGTEGKEDDEKRVASGISIARNGGDCSDEDDHNCIIHENHEIPASLSSFAAAATRQTVNYESTGGLDDMELLADEEGLDDDLEGDSDDIVISGARKMSCTSCRDIDFLCPENSEAVVAAVAGRNNRLHQQYRQLCLREKPVSFGEGDISLDEEVCLDDAVGTNDNHGSRRRLRHATAGAAANLADSVGLIDPSSQAGNELREESIPDELTSSTSSSDPGSADEAEDDDLEDDDDDEAADVGVAEFQSSKANNKVTAAQTAIGNTPTAYPGSDGFPLRSSRVDGAVQRCQRFAYGAAPAAQLVSSTARPVTFGPTLNPTPKADVSPSTAPAASAGGDPAYSCLSAHEWIAAYGPVRNSGARNSIASTSAAVTGAVNNASPSSLQQQRQLVAGSGRAPPAAAAAVAAASLAQQQQAAAMAAALQHQHQVMAVAAAQAQQQIQAPAVTSGSSAAAAPRALKSRYFHYENALIYVAMASKMLEENERQKSNGGAIFEVANRQPFSVFKREPGDPLMKRKLYSFAERLATAMRCKYPCYILALMYLRHVTQKHPRDLPVNSDTFQRLVAIAVVVAAKFYDDLYYSNEHYSRQMGFQTETLNMLEVCFLVLLDFNLHVNRAEFQATMTSFDEWRRRVCAEEHLPVWCGLNTAAVPPGLDVPFAPAIVAHGTPLCATALLVCPPGSLKHLAPLDNPVSGPPHSVLSPGSSYSRGAASCGGAHQLRRQLDAFLASREMRGHRYECEDEYLFKSSLQSRCKVVSQLLEQYNEECRKMNRVTGDGAAQGPSAARHAATFQQYQAAAAAAAAVRVASNISIGVSGPGATGASRIPDPHMAAAAGLSAPGHMMASKIGYQLPVAAASAAHVPSHLGGSAAGQFGVNHQNGIPLVTPVTVAGVAAAAAMGSAIDRASGAIEFAGRYPSAAQAGATYAPTCPVPYAIASHIPGGQTSGAVAAATAFGVPLTTTVPLMALSAGHYGSRRSLDYLTGPTSEGCCYYPNKPSAPALSQCIPQWV